MQFTDSYANTRVVPQHIARRYAWMETGNAAAILNAVARDEYNEFLDVLENFYLSPNSWLVAGGNKGDIAQDLDDRFRALGWKETRIDTEIRGYFLTDISGPKDNQTAHIEEAPVIFSEGFKVDNRKGRMIVDIEWNAKDGNLDRDLAAYRSWYEYGLIDGAVIITKDRHSLLELARHVWGEYQASIGGNPRTRLPIDLSSSTTTSFDKAAIRLQRREAGNCPVLIVGVSSATWDGTAFTLHPQDVEVLVREARAGQTTEDEEELS
ncbi:BglII/BstYI family type II restriction endonuclease [Arthrobacter sp. AL12]|uniref:BglII/BstYI family type II restriction endonuclease n=1 Tax=Arthrobacter sp. AL12 TaxID=3042241 RepID=UPI00249A29FD|nr:BglII/BstYI family type II restriction endonuclease [Arthrobacter sp. AL12]MDI3211776.1 BglII/BstYI family type II restriction endonuclease [Arthrobacter sp. AL12]